jgi:hypothetical protein
VRDNEYWLCLIVKHWLCVIVKQCLCLIVSSFGMIVSTVCALQ